MENRKDLMKTVLNAEPLGYSEEAVYAWKLKGHKYVASSWKEILSKKIFKGVNILIVRLGGRVDREVLNKFPDLETVVSATTGHDHLNIEDIKAQGIRLVSLRGQKKFLTKITATPEHTWGLLLSLVRKIPVANDHVKQGKWERDLFKGHQLQHKTLGIVGLGRIGSKVASYGKSFDMKIQYYDPYVKSSKYKKCNSLAQLLSTSDIVSIHVHLSSETENLLNERNLQNIRQGAFIVNTSRGKVLNERAVVSLMKSKKIAGVASDVLDSELDDISKSQLWKAQQLGYNVIITPHLGGATWESMWECEKFVVGLV